MNSQKFPASLNDNQVISSAKNMVSKALLALLLVLLIQGFSSGDFASAVLSKSTGDADASDLLVQSESCWTRHSRGIDGILSLLDSYVQTARTDNIDKINTLRLLKRVFDNAQTRAQKDKAVSIIEKMHKRFPSDADVRIIAGCFAIERKEWKKADELLLQNNSNFRYEVSLIKALVRMLNSELMLAEKLNKQRVEKICSLLKKLGIARYKVLLLKGKTFLALAGKDRAGAKAALACFDEGLRLCQFETDLLLERRKAYQLLGEKKAAYQDEQILRCQMKLKHDLSLAKAEIESDNRMKLARELVHSVSSSKFLSKDLAMDLIDPLLEFGQVSKAERLVDQFSCDLKDPDYLGMKGYVKTKIKKLDEAESAVKTALESSYLSENLLLRLGLADIQKQKKDWKGIVENCSKARFATNGGQLQVLLLLTKRRALALERLGHPADAIESISTAVKQFEFKGDIRLADLYLQRAALLHKVGKEKEALADREKAAQISSEIIPFSSELWPREAKTGK